MITIFNRKELVVTYSLEEQSRIREILSSNGMEYKIKVTDRTNAQVIMPGIRSEISDFGNDSGWMYEYQIFVKSVDYERAKHLIGR